MIVTFGLLALFFGVVVLNLQANRVHDGSFTDYAVGGRSFGARYQAMSFLNTCSVATGTAAQPAPV